MKRAALLTILLALTATSAQAAGPVRTAATQAASAWGWADGTPYTTVGRCWAAGRSTICTIVEGGTLAAPLSRTTYWIQVYRHRGGVTVTDGFRARRLWVRYRG